MTRKPLLSIMNGVSSALWLDPRYFTIRSRRVEISFSTRWSSRITQSDTYSSSPWRVRVPSPRSAVITAVTSRSFNQVNRRRSSDRRLAWSFSDEKSTSSESMTTRFAPTASMAAPRRMNRPSSPYEPVSSICAGSTWTKSIARR